MNYTHIAIIVAVITVNILILSIWGMTRPNETLFTGNNGTVSGDTYCRGGGGSIDGKNKNMKCTRQIDVATYEQLECEKSYATAAGFRPTNVYCT
jgi:hypothetical protein